MPDDASTRYRGENLPAAMDATHASPYPVSRLAPVHDLVDVAREIAQADAMIGAVVHGKLEVIAEQIRALQQQAREILARAEHDAALHRAQCLFRKRAGQTYHLYRRPDGSAYLSMLSPEEWGRPPHQHAGSWQLLADASWKRVDAQPGSSTKG